MLIMDMILSFPGWNFIFQNYEMLSIILYNSIITKKRKPFGSWDLRLRKRDMGGRSQSKCLPFMSYGKQGAGGISYTIFVWLSLLCKIPATGIFLEPGITF